MGETNYFMYFAYGSNLLKQRIRINNPSAEFVGIGKLDNHQIDFMKWSDNWRGSSATIVPRPNTHVWGAVWKINKRDLPALDRQEGVDTNWYFAKDVEVTRPDGSVVVCRVYQQTINPDYESQLPEDRKPSATYLSCIVTGAIECGLPEEYIEQLKKIPHNGQQACPEMLEKLKNFFIYHYSRAWTRDINTCHCLALFGDERQPKKSTFLYFAYGGNLLQRRIHMHNPSAEFVSIARLDNYRLDFIKYSKFWGGPTATLVPTANAHVWGAVWRLGKEDMLSLDIQKGVDEKKYFPRNFEVLTPYMGSMKCRAYEQRINPLPRGDNDVIPVDLWPSKTYKEILILGAVERGLPPYYVEGLKRLKHNGAEGCLRLTELCIRYGTEKPCECRVPGRIPRKPLKLDLKLLKQQPKPGPKKK